MSTPAYRALADRLPWTPAIAAVAIGFNAAGLLLLLGGWYGAAHSARVGDGAHWADLSALGIAFAALGNAALLAGARARIGRRQRQLAHSRSQRLLAPVQDTPTSTALVGLAGQTLWHTPACPLVEGKAATALDEAALAGRTACGWCSA